MHQIMVCLLTCDARLFCLSAAQNERPAGGEPAGSAFCAADRKSCINSQNAHFRLQVKFRRNSTRSKGLTGTWSCVCLKFALIKTITVFVNTHGNSKHHSKPTDLVTLICNRLEVFEISMLTLTEWVVEGGGEAPLTGALPLVVTQRVVYWTLVVVDTRVANQRWKQMESS